MLHACCGRIIKVQNRMVLLKVFRRHIDFWDKGRAEENIYYMKEQREKLRLMAKQMAEMEKSLSANIQKLEKFAHDKDDGDKPRVKGKKSSKKRD